MTSQRLKTLMAYMGDHHCTGHNRRYLNEAMAEEIKDALQQLSEFHAAAQLSYNIISKGLTK